MACSGYQAVHFCGLGTRLGWGQHTVDWFGSFHNSQLPGFNSRCWNPGSESVDAFTVNWAGETNWLHPPISLIPSVICHAQVCKAKGSLIVSMWPSAPFWPLVCPSQNIYFTPFARLLRPSSLFLPGLSGDVLFHGEVPNTKVLALRCDFSIESGSMCHIVL